MKRKKILHVWVALSCFIVWLGTSAPVRAQPVTYLVTVPDLTPLSGGPGLISFEFNANSPVSAATAYITRFMMPGGTLSGTTIPMTGAVSGDLAAGTLALDNTPVFNIADQLVTTYGSSLSFEVNFVGPALSSPPSPNNTIFALFLYDDVFNTPLQTDVSGSTVQIRLRLNGTTEVVSAAPFATAFIIPEPSTFALLGLGLLLLVCYRRRQRLRREISLRPSA